MPVFEADKRASENALAVVVVDKRNIDARQRCIAESYEIDDGRNAHENQSLGIPDLFSQ